jgi:hypothetical protein
LRAASGAAGLDDDVFSVMTRALNFRAYSKSRHPDHT